MITLLLILVKTAYNMYVLFSIVVTYIFAQVTCNISNKTDGASSGFPNTEKRVENMMPSRVFLTKFEVF